MNCLFCGAKLEETAKVCPKCQKPVQALISINDLKFVPVNRALSTAIEAKKGFFGGGVKKFAQCVAEGRAFLAPVFLENTFSYESDSTEYDCANIWDEAGRPCESAVHLLNYDCIPAGDIIDGKSMDNSTVAAMVLRYQIGKDTNYLILSKKCAADLPGSAKEIVGCIRQNLVERKGPILEGSLLDRAGNGFSRLLGRSGKDD